MEKTVTERIDKYLIGDNGSNDQINEAMLEPSEMGIKPNEYNNISTGLKRIQFRLQKANTPQKYVDAFSVIQQLVDRFPLKSKIIWQAVADAYNLRFGGTNTPAELNSVAPE